MRNPGYMFFKKVAYTIHNTILRNAMVNMYAPEFTNIQCDWVYEYACAHSLCTFIQHSTCIHTGTKHSYDVLTVAMLLPSSLPRGGVSLAPSLGFLWKNAWPFGTRQNHRHRTIGTGAGTGQVLAPWMWLEEGSNPERPWYQTPMGMLSHCTN